jgi:hypothetical protein
MANIPSARDREALEKRMKPLGYLVYKYFKL